MPSDGYISFAGIPGEVTSQGHEGWIEVFSFDQSVAMSINESTVSAGSRSAGRATVSNFTFAKNTAKAGVLLTKACVTGQTSPKVVFEMLRSGEGIQQVYFKFTLSGVLISLLAFNGLREGVPTEKVSPAFGKSPGDICRPAKDGHQASAQEVTWDMTQLKVT